MLKNSWGLLTTHGKMPDDLFQFCLASWKPYYTDLFSWVNNNKNTDLWQYLVNESVSVLVSKNGKGRTGWIREVPYQLGKLMTHIPKVGGCQKPYYVVHFDEDELAPQHPDFESYLQEWIKADSETMLCDWLYFWEDLETVRVDKFIPTALHGFFFKVKPELTWAKNYQGHGCTGTNLSNVWECPYPVGHFNKYNKELRLQHVSHRKPQLLDKPENTWEKRWKIAPEEVMLCKYNKEITREQLQKWRALSVEGILPEGCWYAKRSSS